MLGIETFFDGIDVKQLKRIARLYGGLEAKFSDTHLYGCNAINRASRLDLHKGPSLQILDIGPAFGYFVRACRLLGHHAEGLDMPHEMYEEACSVMGVAVHRHTIRAREPLPEQVAGYDFINMEGFGMPMRSPDERPNQDVLWTDWVYFINDLLDRLNSKGRLAITLNYGRPWQERLRQWREAFGTRADITQDGNHFYLVLR